MWGTFRCPLCSHTIPEPYKRSHESWHIHAPATLLAAS